jgi:hypothetical protein
MGMARTGNNRIQLAKLFIHGADRGRIQEINADIAGRPSGGDNLMPWLKLRNRSPSDISSRADNKNAHYFSFCHCLK